MRQVTSRILARNGYQVITAVNGLDAIEVAAGHPGNIDVLLTDVIMPQMLGKEAAEPDPRHSPAVKVLFMSGYTRGSPGYPGCPRGRRQPHREAVYRSIAADQATRGPGHPARERTGLTAKIGGAGQRLPGDGDHRPDPGRARRRSGPSATRTRIPFAPHRTRASPRTAGCCIDAVAVHRGVRHLVRAEAHRPAVPDQRRRARRVRPAVEVHLGPDVDRRPPALTPCS